MSSIESFPLTWPVAWPRTPQWERSAGQFKMSASRTRQLLSRELDLLGAKQVVISSNVATRRDGLPYANQARPEDPGVVLYFTLNGDEIAIPCDRWLTVDANLRAIGMAIEAIRGMERWGTKQMVKAGFRGYKALPENVIVTPYTTRPWHEVLEVSPTASPEIIKAAYRNKAGRAHPDVPGGSVEALQEVKDAYDQGMEAAS